ncbi:MAG: DnaB-like helicase N-terminal domain-containing protein, partial [Bacteroidales bacterium]
MEQKDQTFRVASRKGNKSAMGLDYGDHGRVPPQASDLEEAVLGAMMLEQNALTNVIDILKAEVFYKEAHQKIFAAIHDLFANSQPV